MSPLVVVAVVGNVCVVAAVVDVDVAVGDYVVGGVVRVAAAVRVPGVGHVIVNIVGSVIVLVLVMTYGYLSCECVRHHQTLSTTRSWHPRWCYPRGRGERGSEGMMGGRGGR